MTAPTRATCAPPPTILATAAWQDDFPEGMSDAIALHANQLRGTVPDQSGLLVVVPSPPRYPPAHDPGSVFRRYFVPQHDGYLLTEASFALPARVRIVTWESLGERADVHPHGVELRAYVGWRVALVAHRRRLLDDDNNVASMKPLRDAVAACGPAGCRPPLRAPATPEALLQPDLYFHSRIADATHNDLLANLCNMLSLALREALKQARRLQQRLKLNYSL